ncbi:sigma-70 family RNA polymerase sigma factor [Spirillospora sp. NPDC048819]|uniref:RNA polymerase sigma factor n=1 Tax=Spirillospora sp. NPDC048819 TaxID=3155268 RepID=UPI0033C1F0AE
MTASPRDAPTVAAPEDDASLIGRSRVEPEVFAVLYDRHAPFIHRYVRRRLGDQAADDLVAETFLAAFRQRRRYDPGRADARPWLYGIAANLIGKQRRAETRMLRALARTGVDPVADSMDRVDARVSAAASARELAGALAELSPGDRDVLLLIAWADLSYEQVAEALSIPVGTVRSRLNRARRKVREALGGIDPTRVQEGTE